MTHSDYITTKVAEQMVRMQEEVSRQRIKIQEMHDYLHGNPHDAIPVSYWEGGLGGGFPYDNEIDFVYIGSRVMTKYGDAWTIESYDAETELFSFKETTKKLGTSRISAILTEEQYQEEKRYREERECKRTG